jgi:hypothetical protein
MLFHMCPARQLGMCHAYCCCGPNGDSRGVVAAAAVMQQHTASAVSLIYASVTAADPRRERPFITCSTPPLPGRYVHIVTNLTAPDMWASSPNASWQKPVWANPAIPICSQITANNDPAMLQGQGCSSRHAGSETFLGRKHFLASKKTGYLPSTATLPCSAPAQTQLACLDRTAALAIA